MTAELDLRAQPRAAAGAPASDPAPPAPAAICRLRRFLLRPGNDSLSHLGKALALRERLITRGHEVHLAVGARRSPFLDGLGVPHHVLPDIQEADHGASPSIAWFRQGERFCASVAAELALLQRLRPDRVVGICHFTAGSASLLAKIPFDSLACGCMLPECEDILGFAPGEPGATQQQQYLRFFHGQAARMASEALSALGLPGVTDVRELLRGDRTFLWDFPEFQPILPVPQVHHVGPLWFAGWPEPAGEELLPLAPRSVALVTFGTTPVPEEAVERLVRMLLGLGHTVVLAAGGNPARGAGLPRRPGFFRLDFAPLPRLLPLARFVVCHGGQMTVFEALRAEVPVLVMPFRPEQAQSGVCLERLGVGARLVPARPFRGDPQVYLDALAGLGADELDRRIHRLEEDEEACRRLAALAAQLAALDGAGALLRWLERSP